MKRKELEFSVLADVWQGQEWGTNGVEEIEKRNWINEDSREYSPR